MAVPEQRQETIMINATRAALAIAVIAAGIAAAAAPANAAMFRTFNGPAAGPAGAQFGRLPTSNRSFVDPTRNSMMAHQTQNSVQATNTQMSTNAVQGRNCFRNAILAGLCQGR
jgi:hypothetical protein